MPSSTSSVRLMTVWTSPQKRRPVAMWLMSVATTSVWSPRPTSRQSSRKRACLPDTALLANMPDADMPPSSLLVPPASMEAASPVVPERREMSDAAGMPPPPPAAKLTPREPPPPAANAVSSTTLASGTRKVPCSAEAPEPPPALPRCADPVSFWGEGMPCASDRKDVWIRWMKKRRACSRRGSHRARREAVPGAAAAAVTRWSVRSSSCSTRRISSASSRTVSSVQPVAERPKDCPETVAARIYTSQASWHSLPRRASATSPPAAATAAEAASAAAGSVPAAATPAAPPTAPAARARCVPKTLSQTAMSPAAVRSYPKRNRPGMASTSASHSS
mmetsp:Transcript_26007/g.97966  ORF Transcript_26007/g.97966 Transcript_26007/m.97966 type:complete len:334 (+) Transcript_26007:1520-2521(+)